VTQKLYSLPEQLTVHSMVFIWSMLIIHCLLCLFMLIIHLSLSFISFWLHFCFVFVVILVHDFYHTRQITQIVDFLMGSVLFIFLVFCVVFVFVLLVFVLCLVYPVLPVSMDCLFLIALSVFSNIDLALIV